MATICKTVKLSRTSVDRVRADYNAVTLERAFSHVEVGDLLPDIEYKAAQERVSKVKPEVRQAIVLGIVDGGIRAEAILDPVPADPRLAGARQKVDPEHDPVVLYDKLCRELPNSR